MTFFSRRFKHTYKFGAIYRYTPDDKATAGEFMFDTEQPELFFKVNQFIRENNVSVDRKDSTTGSPEGLIVNSPFSGAEVIYVEPCVIDLTPWTRSTVNSVLSSVSSSILSSISSMTSPLLTFPDTRNKVTIRRSGGDGTVEDMTPMVVSYEFNCSFDVCSLIDEIKLGRRSSSTSENNNDVNNYYYYPPYLIVGNKPFHSWLERLSKHNLVPSNAVYLNETTVVLAHIIYFFTKFELSGGVDGVFLRKFWRNIHEYVVYESVDTPYGRASILCYLDKFIVNLNQTISIPVMTPKYYYMSDLISLSSYDKLFQIARLSWVPYVLHQSLIDKKHLECPALKDCKGKNSEIQATPAGTLQFMTRNDMFPTMSNITLENCSGFIDSVPIEFQSTVTEYIKFEREFYISSPSLFQHSLTRSIALISAPMSIYYYLKNSCAGGGLIDRKTVVFQNAWNKDNFLPYMFSSHPNLRSYRNKLDEVIKIQTDLKFAIAVFFWDNDDLLEKYVAENPDLSDRFVIIRRRSES